MTISTTTARSGPYAGAGSTGPFTVDFRFLENSHLRVVKTATDGANIDLVLDTDYTVSGAGGATGSVTLIVALAIGEQLTIVRNVPATQEADYVSNDSFPAESHELALDKLTMLAQQNTEALARAVTLPINADGVSTELPTPTANNIIAWNSSADGLENTTPEEIGIVVAAGNQATQYFNGNGTTGPFTLSSQPVALANLEVFIGGVRQNPGVTRDYTVSGTALTFTAATPVGFENIFCRWGSAAEVSVGTPTDGTVTTAKIVDAAVTAIKIADSNVTTAKIADANVTAAKLAASALPRGHLSGLTLSTAGGSATMSIAAGQAVDSTHSNLMALSSSISKTTSAWSVGAGNGGLDTGAIANSTWYHFHLIKRADTGVTDVLFSLSATAPTLPTSYTYSRRIGSGLTNGSGQWVAFTQDGDYFRWSATVSDVNTTNPGTAAVTAALSVPSGVNVIAQFAASLTTGAGTGSAILFSDLAGNDEAPSATNAMIRALVSGAMAGQYQIRTNTSRQIRYRANASDANVVIALQTFGWIDRRGRDA